jgi:hypothetical protein
MSITFSCDVRHTTLLCVQAPSFTLRREDVNRRLVALGDGKPLLDLEAGNDKCSGARQGSCCQGNRKRSTPPVSRICARLRHQEAS